MTKIPVTAFLLCLLLVTGAQQVDAEVALVSPINGTEHQSKPWFSWSGPAKYDRYFFYSVFYYDRSPSFAGYYRITFWMTGSAGFGMPADWWKYLGQDMIHYWAVVGVDTETGESSVSALGTFTKNLLPVILLSPADGEVMDNGSNNCPDTFVHDFTWEAVPEARFYEMEFGNQYGTWTRGSVTNSTHIEGNTTDAGPRTWRVRANYADLTGWSDWSEMRTFIVEPPNLDCPATAR